jgi:tryptophan 7-halogenase
MTDSNAIRSIVILGGGTAGWMAAASLSRIFEGKMPVTLIESDEIGTVGVGEATIPQIRVFNQALGLDENDFIRNVQGTFKLGIQFVDWLRPGHSYVHAFGPVGGRDLGLIQFYQYWAKLHAQGKVGPLDDYVFNSVASRANKFTRPVDVPNSPLSNIFYAFHFDAGLYARYLRAFSEQRGVQRVEGKAVHVSQREDGFIDSITLESGQTISGDLFIDCSGFRGVLIEETLKTGYTDWSRYLPCNRAWAVPCAAAGELIPYTRSTARSAGWQWRIGLQHRTGNGYVYSNRYIDDDQARETLLNNLDGAVLAEPRQLRFVTGMRNQFWNKNVIAMGLSSGFLEPLESTSIHFIQSSLAKLMALFPTRGFNPVDIAEYNRQTQFEFIRSRDFLVLHYHATERDDSEFWRYTRSMDIPDTLAHKLELFREGARFFREGEELFCETSWVQVMVGQNILPKRYHPMVDVTAAHEIEQMVAGVREVHARCVEAMPSHARFIERHCRAGADPLTTGRAA